MSVPPPVPVHGRPTSPTIPDWSDTDEQRCRARYKFVDNCWSEPDSLDVSDMVCLWIDSIISHSGL